MHPTSYPVTVRLIIVMLGLMAFTTRPFTTCVGQESKATVIIRPNQEADDEAQIRRVLQQQSECWNRADIEGFMETYWKSPDLTFSSGGQTTRGWDATLQRYKTRYATPDLMGQLKFEVIEVNMLGKEAAFLLGTYQLTRNNDSPHGNFTLVLRKINGHWKIVHDHSSEATE